MYTIYVFLAAIHLFILILIDWIAFPNTGNKGKSDEEVYKAKRYERVFNENFPFFSRIYPIFYVFPILYFVIYILISNKSYLYEFNSLKPFIWVAVFSILFIFIFSIKVKAEYNKIDFEMKSLQPNIGLYLAVFIYAASVLTSFFTVHFLNSALDFYKPEEIMVTVTGTKWSVTRSRHRGYTSETNHYKVYTDSKIGGISTFEVSLNEFNKFAKGDKVKILINKGFYGMPYWHHNWDLIKKEKFDKDQLENKVANNDKLEEIVSSLIKNMVECPAGSFIMGSPKNHDNHKVTLTKPFFIGKYEVTQKEYTLVIGSNPSRFKDDNKPVDNVSWLNAKEFCELLNKYGKSKPKGYRFDLPTEAQWEYACRAGTNTDFNNGKNITGKNKVCYELDEIAWFSNNANYSTHPVGQKIPNAWGIYDMHGNVAEWCRDYFSSNINEEVDPFVSVSGLTFSVRERVVRGGSYYTIYDSEAYLSCTSFYRYNYNEKFRDGFVGFRIALVSEE